VSVWSIALTFFLVWNPVGNSPAIIALVKDFEFERQKKILLREAIIALIIALFFQFFGEVFLTVLHVKDYAVTLTGGILLLFVALNMIFNVTQVSSDVPKLKQEPFIVPIATPILSGPGLMAIIMLYSRQENNNLKICSAILIAWIGVIVVLATAPYLQKIIGKRGLIALEQLMGMILALMSTQMIVNGSHRFMNTL
jgi:multiple antibiotic resistance protein